MDTGGRQLLYNRKSRDFHLAKLEMADSLYWAQIAHGESAISLMTRIHTTDAGRSMTWNDLVAWKRRSIMFRTVRVGMAMTDRRQAERLGNSEMLQKAKRKLRALRVCPNTLCFHFGHRFDADSCMKCGEMLSGGEDAQLTHKVEPPVVTKRLCSLYDYKRLRSYGIAATATVRPRGLEVAILETDSLRSDLEVLLALRGIETPTRKLLGGYRL